MNKILLIFAVISLVFAEIHIPLFGGFITIRNNSDGSFTVGTEKVTSKNMERHTKFTIRNGTVADFEFTSNSTTIEPESSRKRPSQQRPKSDVLNALLSMFGRF